MTTRTFDVRSHRRSPWLGLVILAACVLLGLQAPGALAQNPPDPVPEKPPAEPSGASGAPEAPAEAATEGGVELRGGETTVRRIDPPVRRVDPPVRPPARVQTGPVDRPSRGPTMAPAERIRETDHEPAVEIDPEMERRVRAARDRPDMATELRERERRPNRGVRGELPPFAEARKTPQPLGPDAPTPRGRGEGAEEERSAQGRALADEAKGSKHLKLVLKLRPDGTTEVLSATEFDGGAVLSEVPSSDYLYEVSYGDRLIAVEALAGNPFEVHSFGGPEDVERGHYRTLAEEATIVVQVPNVTLDQPLERLEVRIHRLEEGPVLERVSPEVLQRLRSEGRLESVRSLRGAELAPAIRRGVTRRPPS